MFNIRRMAKKDENSVLSLLGRHFPHVGITPEKLALRLARGARFFVAEKGGEVVGFCELRLGKNALLRGIAVGAGARGSGAGTALINRAVEEARKEGRPRIYLKVEQGNEEAIRVYGRLGFSVVRETVGKQGERLFLMRKELET